MAEIESKTVDRILQASIASFAEQGFEGARMDQIAAKAKVNKATIYYHIGGKKALYGAVLHQILSEQLAFMDERVESAGTPQEQLRAIIQSLRRLIQKKPYIPTILMREVAAGGKHLPEIFFQDLIQIISLLRRVLEAGCAQGEFEPVHPIVVQLMTVAPFVFYSKLVPILQRQGLFHEQGTSSMALSFDDFADQVEKNLLKAILVQ